jgi:archaellum component FlaF (FlaF/FlaG flagellin family)
MPVASRMRITGGRLVALLMGIPLVVAASGDAAFTLVGFYVHASEHHQVSYPGHGGAISLQTSAGSVNIVVGNGNEVGVSYTEHYQLKRPTVTSTTSGGGVQIVARCPGGLLGQNCQINYVLTVPADVSLTIHTGDGPITTTGTTGVQSYNTGDGDIRLTDVAGSVTARTGDGGIDATSLSATSLDATTGDGGISAAWTTAPTSVVAITGDGSIDVLVPGGSYRVSVVTGDGHTSSTVPDDPAASSSISAHTGNGGIRIGLTHG